MAKTLTPSQSQAEALAVELLQVRSRLAGLQAEAAQDLARTKELYAGRLGYLKVQAVSLDKKLKALAKRHKAELFTGPGSQVSLPHVVLTFDVETHVKKVAGVLEALEELALLELVGAPGYEGFAEAIRTEKNVRWEILEKWGEARLLLVGTERLEKEVFSYELQEPKV
jgi:phage host-nuclease inhibitor protein Gam